MRQLTIDVRSSQRNTSGGKNKLTRLVIFELIIQSLQNSLTRLMEQLIHCHDDFKVTPKVRF